MDNFQVAIVGPPEVTAGFAAVGVQALSAETAEQALEQLQTVRANLKNKTGKQFAVVFVLEDLLKEIPQEDYDKLTKDALPAIIPLPGHAGSSGFGNEKLRRIVEKAVGSDIFS